MSLSAPRALLLLVCASVICGAADLGGAPQRPGPRGPSRATESTILGRLPIDFVENRGQWDRRVNFLARQGPMTASVEQATLTVRLETDGPAAVSLTFEGASADAVPAGEGRRPTHYNFYMGSDSGRWRSDVPAGLAARGRGGRPLGLGAFLRGRHEIERVTASWQGNRAMSRGVRGWSRLRPQ